MSLKGKNEFGMRGMMDQRGGTIEMRGKYRIEGEGGMQGVKKEIRLKVSSLSPL